MEHWLAEESTVMAMINLSQCNRSFTEESLMAAQRVRSRTKMFKLAEQAFQSKLEISFLSEFDLKGSETVMDRQASIARAFVPHTSLDKNNLEPLIDVLKRNAAGHQVAAYRYLWADFASASVFAALRQSHQTNPESAVKRFRADVRRSVLLPGAAANFGTLLGLYASQTLATTDLLKLYKIE
jgi:Zn-dependent oligopeptidase